MSDCFYDSPIGLLRISVDDGFLTGISLAEQIAEEDILSEPDSLQREVIRQLEEYFQRRRKTFTIPMKPEGTVFQKRAWQTLTEIPYGETISYAEEARRMRSGARAVGGANGKNPIIIVIPCHRVIRSDGEIGGYTGGVWIKKYLLELEHRNSAK